MLSFLLFNCKFLLALGVPSCLKYMFILAGLRDPSQGYLPHAKPVDALLWLEGDI